MIVFGILFLAIFCLVFILRGEGADYGKARETRDKINYSDKNYFL